MGLRWELYFDILSLTPARPAQQSWCAVYSKLHIALLVRAHGEKQTWQFSTIHPLTCTVLLSPGGRSRSLTAFCWSQELACSVKHKGFLFHIFKVSSPHLQSRNHIKCKFGCVSSDFLWQWWKSHTLSQRSYWGEDLYTANSTTVQSFAVSSKNICFWMCFRTVVALHTRTSQTSSPKIALFYGPEQINIITHACCQQGKILVSVE